MKGTDNFKKTISEYLDTRAEQDELFAVTLKKENKSIDECVNYILSEVQKSGCNGFDDKEIFGMAVHYYDEDDIKKIKPVSGRAVVNHQVELSEEEKAEAKKKAMDQAILEAKEEAKSELSKNVKLSSEDIAEAKKMAIEKIASESKEKLTKKNPAPAKKDNPEEEQVFLFE